MSYLLPAGFLLRRPTFEDINALLEMSQAYDLAEFGRVRTSESDLRNLWELPGHDSAQDAWQIIAPDGQTAAFAFVGHPAPISRFFVDLRVHPDFAGLGLYDFLYDLILERASALIPEAPEGARVSLSIWCPEKNAELRQAAEQAELKHIRSNWVMRIDMDQPPPEPVWPEGIELRPYTPELSHAVYRADDEAFRDHWGHMRIEFEVWQLWMVKRSDFDPSLWFLAFDGEEIAGFSLCSYQQGESWVGELGVLRPWRKKGLGLAFLYHSFGEFYRRGERTVVLNVDSQNLTGATRLYRRAGMRPVEQTDVYELELRPGIELSTQALTV